MSGRGSGSFHIFCYAGRKNSDMRTIRMRKDNKIQIYLIFMIAITFGIFQFSSYRICGFSIYPDEFGYWATGAGWIGYDWSQCTALGSYYSYGYSVILMVILTLCKSTVAAYRTAVAVNFILQGISIILLWRILGYFFRDSGEAKLLFVAGISAFYPPWILYMQMTLTEGILTFLYLLIVYLILSFTEKPGILKCLGLEITLIYLYFVHMRTIGVLIAGGITLFAIAVRSKRHRVAVTVSTVMGIGFLIAGILIKQEITESVYRLNSVEQLATNDYAGQWQKLRNLIQGKSILQLLESMVGKLFYLGAASYGMCYFAGIFCYRKIKETIQKIRDKQEIYDGIYGIVFITLSFLAQYFISAVYLVQGTRMDTLVYGRYNDFVVPLLMGIGLMTLVKCKRIRKWFLAIGILQGGLLVATIYAARQMGNAPMQAYFAAGISYLWSGENFVVTADFVKAYVGSMLMFGVISFCIWLSETRKSPEILGIVLTAQIVLGLLLSYRYVYLFNDINRTNIRVAEWVMEHAGENDIVWYLEEGGLPYIDLIQFYLEDRTIQVLSSKNISDDELLQKEGYLIVSLDSERIDRCLQKDEAKVRGANFAVYELDVIR